MDAHARQELIERHMPLARSLALRYRRTSEPVDDLIQVASLGLVKAAARWDPGRGHAFSSFAVPTILGEIRRHFRDSTWLVRPPRDLLELSLVVERTRERLSAAGGREPTVAELAAELGRSPQAIAEALRAAEARCASPLDAGVTGDDPGAAAISHAIGCDDAGYERIEARSAIEHLMSILDQRAREILRLRFDHDLLQTEIADALGCSQVQVSRIIRVSLEKLAAYASGMRGEWPPVEQT
jgi:RNA polymerase sigma-B factor